MADEDHASNEDADVLYKAPATKTVAEILAADQDDASLERYKQKLLGQAPQNVVIDPSDTRIVIVKRISLVVEGRPDVSMDLDKPAVLENATFKLKEGTQYRLRFEFYVQREIVTGLKYTHKVTRHGVKVDGDTVMVGSYAPKADLQAFMTAIEEAPSGMLHRGKYKVKSKFIDDDKHEWLSWEWTLEITKDW